MAAISHPNLAAVYDWGEEQIGRRGTVYVVVEYLSGGNLRDLFDRGRHLTPSQALMVGLEACRGLDFAHRKGLVHTELTPSKLVFGDDRRLRIVDFGLARILGETDWKEPSRLATHVARYASPEQAEGKPLDGHTDVYSLALILVEAVSGHVPFDADSTVATLSARIGKLMPVSADLGPLAAVLERAGRPEAAERFSASQFGRALVRAADKLPRPAPIPILATSIFEDPAAMRAPNDPTGGIARPPAGPARRSSRVDDPGVADRRDRRDHRPAEGDQQPRRAGCRRDAGPLAEPATRPPPTTPGSPTTHEFGDLAALVESTPTAAGGRAAGDGTGARRRAARPPPARQARQEQPAGPQEGGQGPAQGRQGRKRRRRPRPPRPGPPVPPAGGPAPAPVAGPRSRSGAVGCRGSSACSSSPCCAVSGTSPGSCSARRRTRFRPWSAFPADEALALVDDFEWEITVDDGRSDEYRTPGQVILTSPSAGEDLAEGLAAAVVVSEGPEFRQRSRSQRAHTGRRRGRDRASRARRRRADHRVQRGRARRHRHLVERRGGAARRRRAPRCRGRAGGLRRPQPRRAAAARPHRRGGDAVARRPRTRPRRRRRGLRRRDPAGEIATQNPAVDTTLDRGGTITANVSKGPDLVTFPDLTGMTLPQIGQALTDAGLRVGNLLGSTQGTFVAASVDGEEVAPAIRSAATPPVNIIILV